MVIEIDLFGNEDENVIVASNKQETPQETENIEEIEHYYADRRLQLQTIYELSEKNKNFILTIKDEGPGFSETVVQNIFKRFYSNRPHSFGEHSGLGLNIVKNIIFRSVQKDQVLIYFKFIFTLSG